MDLQNRGLNEFEISWLEKITKLNSFSFMHFDLWMNERVHPRSENKYAKFKESSSSKKIKEEKCNQSQNLLAFETDSNGFSNIFWDVIQENM